MRFKFEFFKTKYFAVIALVIVANIIVLTTASIMFQANNNAFGMSILAYVFGLKHAIDADHIAAIDNVTRLLVSKGQKPCTVGLFFALGHSTVVLVSIVMIVISLNSINFSSYESISQIVGPAVSFTFLMIVGIVNCIAIYYILKSMKNESSDDTSPSSLEVPSNKLQYTNTKSIDSSIFSQKLSPIISNSSLTCTFTDTLSSPSFPSSAFDTEDIEPIGIVRVNDENGLVSNSSENRDVDSVISVKNNIQRSNESKCNCVTDALFRLLNSIDKPWKMYFIGVVFGLGFDTASEVALLGLSISQSNAGDSTGGSKNVPLQNIIILPLLFAAGMSLIDTIDSFLMLRIYGFSSLTDHDRLKYSLVVTVLSVSVAFFIGLLQLLSLVASAASPTGSFWDVLDQAGQNFALIGGVIAAAFCVSFIVSYFLLKSNQSRKVDDNNNDNIQKIKNDDNDKPNSTNDENTATAL